MRNRSLAPRAVAIALMSAALGYAGESGARAVKVPLPRPRQPVKELGAALSSPDVETRAAAAWALAGARKVPGAVYAALAKARLEDPEPRVRLGAAWALGHLDIPKGDHSTDADVQPRLRSQTFPDYPAAAREKDIHGTVNVEFLIDEQGHVAHAEVRDSIPALDEAAVRCVKGWTFEPLTRDGRPLAVMAAAPVTFRRD